MHSLRKLILSLMLALATLFAGSGYAQARHDDCGCCTETQQMVCAACKTCVSHALMASPVTYLEEAPRSAGQTTHPLNPSGHTEDIWHPPRALS
ncbi:MAG: hypothetical protein K2Q19_06675 [Rhodocyclaceae bacterium]|nr:hypothetical protein [Rhodocyclaceae bacterium]